MSSRFKLVLGSLAVASVAVIVVVVVNVASSPSKVDRRADRALLVRCAKVVLGVGRGSATAVASGAGPEVASHLAVFRRMRSAAGLLPASAHLGEAVAGAGATTYDPAALVRLTSRRGSRGAVYAVPATMAVSKLPADCRGLPQFAGASAYLALQAQEMGSGPGVCLISTQLEQGPPSGLFLPGATPPKPTRTLTIAQTACESDAVMSGYVGALGGSRGRWGPLALIPDGVSAITYTLSDGHQITVPVAGNLAVLPAALSKQTALQHPTDAELARVLSTHLPTTVTERGAGASLIATLTRPVSLVTETMGSLAFLRRLLTPTSVTSSSVSSGGGGSMTASCSARSHRCVAVVLTTTCARQHCRTSRAIYRYRYIGAKPPAGFTGPNQLPTAPIIARTNRFVARPTKLALLLGGTPQRHVVVILSVNCFSRDSGTSGGGPALRVAVPSRTQIALPGPARRFDACDVGALVTSTRPDHGSVHVTVARG